MNIEYHKWFSRNLGRHMELKVYGHAGQPFIVFPTSSGRFFDFENQGMVAAAGHFVDNGKIILFAVDTNDHNSWDNKGIHPEEKARHHNEYDSYIMQEVVPFIQGRSGNARIMCTGVSMGASHSVLFFFRHPDVFKGTIALSGIYDFRYFLDGYQGGSADVYYNMPFEFLPNLDDPRLLGLMRDSSIVVCVGQGAWEEPMIRDTRRLQEILARKEIPAWIDFWGYDVNHDWPWWRIQFPYFLKSLYEV